MNILIQRKNKTLKRGGGGGGGGSREDSRSNDRTSDNDSREVSHLHVGTEHGLRFMFVLLTMIKR